MNAAWIIRALVASGLISAAAFAIAHLAKLSRRPQRWIWGAAMVLSVALPWMGGVVPVATPPWLERMWNAPAAVLAARDADVTTRTNGALTAMRAEAPRDSHHSTAEIIAVLWIAASGLAFVIIAGVYLRLARARRLWELKTIAGHPVLISSAMGPAVVGILRPTIVVPRWVLSVPADMQALIVRHEAEHVRRGDVWLLGGAALAVAVMPWNVLLWWQYLQVRDAIETDCDARVVAAGVDVRAYGTLLIDIAARVTGVPALSPALRPHPILLERRILNMTEQLMTPSRLRMTALTGMSAGFCFLACVAVAQSPAPMPPSVVTVALRDSTAPKETAKKKVTVAPKHADQQVDTSNMQGASPLVVLNGVPITEGNSPLDQIDPNIVESITVLKGAEATTKYGAMAKNGVIVILTKRGLIKPDTSAASRPDTAKSK